MNRLRLQGATSWRLTWHSLLLSSILSLHTGFLAYSAFVHSPVFDEPAYVVAGISHWKFHRYELYRVNPPLIRLAATLPILLVEIEEDWSSYADAPGAQPVFQVGRDFVTANGIRTYRLITLGRLACIPFSWLGAIICYLWSRDLFGRTAGLLSSSLWCFSPTILGHAALLSANAHSAALGIAASYVFWLWLKDATWESALLSGIGLGAAELAKTTLILLYPSFLASLLIASVAKRSHLSRAILIQRYGMFLGIVFVSVFVINLGYGFQGSGTRLGDFKFVSRVLSGHRNLYPGQFENRFTSSVIADLPVPLPRDYVLGMDVQQMVFEGGTFQSYLRGEFRSRGWWYYYLYAVLIKVPIGTILIAVLAFENKPWKSSSDGSDLFAILCPCVVIFVVASFKSGFSHHMYYVLPCFPFAFVLLGQVCQRRKANRHARKQGVRRLFAYAVAVCLCWSITSSIWIYPHSLAYFNEFVGGPLNGPKHLLLSNVDWGQDLLYLKRWVEGNPDSRPLHLAYHGFLDPASMGFAETLPWPQANVPDDILDQQSADVYAISANLLYGCGFVPTDGARSYSYGHDARATGEVLLDKKLLNLLRSVHVETRIGYSIFVFQ